MDTATTKPRSSTPFENVSLPVHREVKVRMNDACWHLRLTLRQFVAAAIEHELARLEKEHGAIPRRGGAPLPRGRRPS
jgi:hypothetical protein